MDITFSLPHVFHPGADPVENAYVLRKLLNLLVDINTGYLLRRQSKGVAVPSLYGSGVAYGRTHKWLPIPALYQGPFKGDCKSLAPALIAEYLVKGVPAVPVFRGDPQADGTYNFHILVQTESGFSDPSKDLGMGDNEFSKLFFDTP